MLCTLFAILRRAAASVGQNARTASGKGSVHTMPYIKRFEAYIYTKLGGLDMAEEFFRRHPDLRRLMYHNARYHCGKRGASWKGAAIFYRWHIRPRLRADREAAMKTPL